MTERLLELVEQKAYAKLRGELIECNEADIAAFLEELTDKHEMIRIFRVLPKDMAADVFAFLPIEEQQQIITSMTDREAGAILSNLFADDAADLMEEMPAGVVKRLLANTDAETRQNINQLLRYPEDSAGSIMTVEFADLKAALTVEEAIAKLRKIGVDKETIYTCYVLDPQRRLIGAVSLRKLLLSRDEEKIEDIMEERPISTHTLMDQEEVALMFQKYDFTSMPVVDSENRLVGIITVDDIVDIMQQEATEDIEKMAAITSTDVPYMREGVFETFKKRIPWLLLLMISAAFTGEIIQMYESALAACVVLTSFIPMLMGTGGNAGGQASATIIRGLSLDEIEFSDFFRVVWKELRVALLCGVTLAAANFVKLLVVDRVTPMIALVVCITLIATLIAAKFVGAALPILAKKIGMDPAVVASPIITTILDILSLVIYFRIAVELLLLG
ncbi:MAG: magnesium transporter [Ruminococcaceae bacterium]|nr:magnesium transporter [Oscillospiraceae bacterium]